MLRQINDQGRVKYKDIKELGVRYHIDRMRKLGLLDMVYENGSGYVVFSLSLLNTYLETDLLPALEGEGSCGEV